MKESSPRSAYYRCLIALVSLLRWRQWVDKQEVFITALIIFSECAQTGEIQITEARNDN